MVAHTSNPITQETGTGESLGAQGQPDVPSELHASCCAQWDPM